MKFAVFFENVAEACEATGISAKDALIKLKENGLDMIYLARTSIEAYDGDLLALFHELELPIEGFHETIDYGEEPEREDYKDCIDLAAKEGANNILLVPGFVTEDQEDEREIRIARMVEMLKKAVAYAADKGVDICMEDYDAKKAPYCNSDGLKYFIDAVPGLCVMPDTGNFIIDHENEVEAFEKFRGYKICGMHLKDRSLTPKNADDTPFVLPDGALLYPTPVGQGYIDIKTIISELKEDGYKGNAVLEMFGIQGKYMLDAMISSLQFAKTLDI